MQLDEQIADITQPGLLYSLLHLCDESVSSNFECIEFMFVCNVKSSVH